MTSTDIIISLINSRFDAQDSAIQAIRHDNKELRAEIQQDTTQLRYEINLVKHDTEHLQLTVYWGFAIIAFVSAFVSVFQKEPREKSSRDYLSRAEVQAMIDAAMNKKNPE